jgi:hypothetical protein
MEETSMTTPAAKRLAEEYRSRFKAGIASNFLIPALMLPIVPVQRFFGETAALVMAVIMLVIFIVCVFCIIVYAAISNAVMQELAETIRVSLDCEQCGTTIEPELLSDNVYEYTCEACSITWAMEWPPEE